MPTKNAQIFIKKAKQILADYLKKQGMLQKKAKDISQKLTKKSEGKQIENLKKKINSL